MRTKRVAMLMLMVGLLMSTGCCRMCRRWCGPETQYAAPVQCCPPPACQPCCPQPAYPAPAGYYAPPAQYGSPDCCSNACTTPAPATGVAPGNQWQRAYKPECYCR